MCSLKDYQTGWFSLIIDTCSSIFLSTFPAVSSAPATGTSAPQTQTQWQTQGQTHGGSALSTSSNAKPFVSAKFDLPMLDDDDDNYELWNKALRNRGLWPAINESETAPDPTSDAAAYEDWCLRDQEARLTILPAVPTIVCLVTRFRVYDLRSHSSGRPLRFASVPAVPRFGIANRFGISPSIIASPIIDRLAIASDLSSSLTLDSFSIPRAISFTRDCGQNPSNSLCFVTSTKLPHTHTPVRSPRSGHLFKTFFETMDSQPDRTRVMDACDSTTRRIRNFSAPCLGSGRGCSLMILVPLTAVAAASCFTTTSHAHAHRRATTFFHWHWPFLNLLGHRPWSQAHMAGY